MDDLNVRIAKLLGWTNLYDAEWIDDCVPGRRVKAVCGTAPDGEHDYVVPDFRHDLNAVVTVLARHDCTLTLDFGPAYSASVLPEQRIDDPVFREFRASSNGYYRRHGQHADISELAALAFADWLTWQREQGGRDD